ncbi:MAG: 3-hydroxybutyryl-CoA dehydrogenase [Chlamydiales bacterium]|jgi:3-hydroxybutyryl-CoA dehydrogenase
MATMQATDIGRAAVIGAGTMGHGIAQILAMTGIETRLFDVDAGAVERGLGNVRANLAKGVARGKVDAEQEKAALALVQGMTDMTRAVQDVDLVIEAVPEKLDLKKSIFAEVSRHVGPTTLLATNTSSLSVGEIAAAASSPERVVGMHFFNPVHIMKLVEVVRAETTEDRFAELALGLARRMGRDPIDVKDAPGFASSRLGVAIGMEAIRMVESGVASVEDVDKAMVLGYGFPMGPLKLTDLVGLDVRLSIAEYLTRELGPRFEPPQLLRQRVADGDLGKKTGRGFYDWTE